MTRANSPSQALGTLGRKLLACFSLEWVTFLPDLYWLARSWINQRSPLGMYEILEYDSVLELLDPKGKTATLTKRQRVKFLQDNVLVFPDYAWGDGRIFVDYRCSPGEVVDRYKEGDRWNILISLRETKKTGDVTEFHITHTVKEAFVAKHEWRQIEIRHWTRRLRMTVVFPKTRPCSRAVLVQRSTHRTTELGPEHFVILPDGRQQLTWETNRIKQFEIYTLKWTW